MNEQNLELESKKGKIGNVIVLAGAMDSGKSPIVKRIVKKCNLPNKFVNDVNNEYPDDFSKFHKENTPIYLSKLNTFKNSALVIEEASAYIGSYKDAEIMSMLVGVAHNHNIIIFVFHGIRYIPQYLADLTRYVILTHPLDHEDLIYERFRRHYDRLIKERERVKKIVKDYSTDGFKKYYNEHHESIGKFDVYIKNR